MLISTEAVAIVGILSTLASGLITALFSYLQNRASKKSDERKHRQELILKTALDSYKQYCEITKASGQTGTLLPVEDFIFIMMKASEIIDNGKINISEVEQKLAEVTQLKDIMWKHHQDWKADFKRINRT